MSSPVGTASTVQTATVTLASGGTIGSIGVLFKGTPGLDFQMASGGTCAVGTAYAAGNSCTVAYTFTPSAPGLRPGGIVLSANDHSTLGTTYISGVGVGPRLTFSPPHKVVLNNSIFFPHCLEEDGAGNLYTVDQDDSTVKEVLRSSNYTTVVKLATNVFGVSAGSSPTCAAMDGLGNLFVSDGIAKTVTELFAQSGYTQSAVLPVRLHYPNGIAVDAAGNVFVADQSAAKIVEISKASGYTSSISFGSGMTSPLSIAVDPSGNVFVADSTRNAVYEIPAAGGYASTNKLLNISDPSGIALDTNANAFAVSQFGPIVEMFSSSGYSTNTQIATADYTPFGVTVDGLGNVFVAEVLQMTEYDAATPPSLSFANTPVGSTSSDSPNPVTINNAGNAPLVFTAPASGANPSITSGFGLDASSTCGTVSAGGAAFSLAANASCDQQVSFTPVAIGPDSGALVFTDNDLNVAGSTQTVPLNATATGPTQPPTIASVTPSTGPATGNTVTSIAGTRFVGVTAVNFGAVPAVSFTVDSSTQITAVSPAGTGAVDIAVTNTAGISARTGADRFTYTAADQTINFPALPSPAYAGLAVQLNATASSGLPVTYTVLSGPARLSGAILTYTGAGPVTVQASQAGNATYSAAAAVTQTASPTVLVVPVGSTSAVLSTAVVLSSTGALANVAATTTGVTGADFAATAGGSCSVGTTYLRGTVCTVNFTLSPRLPGLRMGGIALTTASGEPLATALVYGKGTGPLVNFAPAQSVKLLDASRPVGLAVDALGNNLYFAAWHQGVFRRGGSGPVSTVSTAVLDGAGIAVDGAGNLFVADDEGETVTEFLAPSLTNWVAIGTGWQNPSSVAVDAEGNLFVSDRNAQTVQEFTAASGYVQARQLGKAEDFALPQGVAVDADGNLFVVNGGSGTVIRLSPTDQYASTATVASGLSAPKAMAVDAAGNLYIANTGAGTLVQLSAASGYSAMQTLVAGTTITGVTVDARGNVYASDTARTQITELDMADPPTVTFADTVVGSTSADSPKTVTLTNVGTDSLVFTAPSTGMNPTISSGFTLGAAGTCPQLGPGSGPAATLAAGASCTEMVSFTPAAVGSVSGQLVIGDNHLNQAGATQVVPLLGRGITTAAVMSFSIPDHTFGDAPFAVTANSTSPGAITYSVVSGPATISGNIVSVTGAGAVTVMASQVASGAYAAATVSANFVVHTAMPAMSFAVANHVFGDVPFAVTASSNSPGAITYSVVSGPATVSGSVVTITGAGNVTLMASQAATANFAVVSQSASFSVSKAAQAISFPAPATPVAYNAAPVTLAATASSGLPVVFRVVSGPGSLNGAVLSFTGSGTVVIAAAQAGDANFAPAPEVQQSIVVLPPITENFTLTAANPDVTITHGGTAVYSLTLTPVGAPYTASDVALSLTGAPDGSAITFAPAEVPSNSGATAITLTIQTPNHIAGPFESARAGSGEIALAVFGLGVWMLPKRRTRKLAGAVRVLGLGAVVGLLVSMSGCGWGWGTQHWTIEVKGTSAKTVTTATLKLTSAPQ